ncbi:receptor-like protein kinase [Macadamia integrifolia]|uniref:receptor-like protein kinase n=1 Tax=Macadamia integrifolia TaxID=60698 RepID=UPI001C4EA5EB|nr:receptor-like protein kinase [Macadamia integrifolia]
MTQIHVHGRGVTCSNNNRSIIRLSFPSSKLYNSDFLADLCQIDTLDQNRLSGPLPNFSGFGGLQYLDLSYNSLAGSIDSQLNSGGIPESLSSIKTLSRFAAYQNSFSGIISSGISRYLGILDLSYNKLSGLIPSDFLSSSTLQYVDLSYNSLEGPIPSNFSPSFIRLILGGNSLNSTITSLGYGILSKLIYLDLNKNSFTGFVPPQLGNFQSLALLNLAQNEFYGPLPEELGNLHQLQVVQLQSNRLTGEIPPQFSQLQKLSILNISRNSLTGSIPSEISSLGNLIRLDLRDNSFGGSIPNSIGYLKSLIELQLGNNNLSGKIPSMPSNLQIALNLSRNHLNFHINCTLTL